MESRTISYLETALWASTVSLPCDESELVDGCMDIPDGEPLSGVAEGWPLDRYFDLDDFTDAAKIEAEEDCDDFFDHLDRAGLLEIARHFADDDRIAYDFWLTRNGHGAGFWDGDYDDDEHSAGRELTSICEAWGSRDVVFTDSGQLELF